MALDISSHSSKFIFNANHILFVVPTFSRQTTQASIGDIISLVRSACRATEPKLAAQFMSEAGVAMPAKDDSSGTDAPAEVDADREALIADVRAALYPSLTSALFRAGGRRKGLAALEDMARGRVAITVDAANR